MRTNRKQLSITKATPGLRTRGPHLPNIPRIDAFPSRATWETAVWDAFLSHTAKQRDTGTLRDLFRVILAPPERKNIIARISAIARIRDGMSYKEIEHELWLAPQTISTIKKALHEQSYKSYNERGKKERVSRKVGSILPAREPYRRRVRTKYGTKYMRPL